MLFVTTPTYDGDLCASHLEISWEGFPATKTKIFKSLQGAIVGYVMRTSY